MAVSISSSLGATCNSHYDCHNVGSALCSNDKKCICRKNYIAINNATCMPILGGRCYKHNDCIVDNSVCINDTCECGPKYNYLSDNMCIITTLGSTCKNVSDCGDNYRFECSEDNKCICKENFEVLNNSTCAPKLGKTCTKEEKCLNENSLCIDGKCQCTLGYRSALNDTCVVSMLGKSCEHDIDCDDLNHLQCSGFKVCICRSYHMSHISSCLSLLYRFCDNDRRCKVNNSICIDNVCQCKDGYIADSPFMCLPSILGQNCTSNFDCEKDLYAQCSDAGICVCRENHVMKNHSRCEPLIGGLCYDNESCKIGDSTCIDNKCQCNPGFLNTDPYKCLPTTIGKICVDSFDCNNIWHMKCSPDKICVCKEHHRLVNNASCMPLLGTICMFEELCAPENSICVDHECQCLPTFQRESNDYCVPTKLGYQCTTNSDCGDLEHIKCSDDHICVCSEYHKMVNRAMCLPLLNGFCTDDRPCFVENSACIDNKCQCQDGYFSVLHDQCIAREL